MIDNNMSQKDPKLKLQSEYEKLIKTTWIFLNNTYEPINKKHFHRTELQDIKLIETIKQELKDKIGVFAIFVFLTDFCNKFHIPGPYRDIEKGLIIIYHLISGLSINQMEIYLNYTNFFKIYKYIYITKYDELNNWINKLMYNCFSNKNIRLLSSYMKNPEISKHITLILDGHHNKIVYENVTMDKDELYSWKLKKPGLNTQFVIDVNDVVVYVSESLPCKDNNDDLMFINNINFNNFFTIYDNMCFDGLYVNTLYETIAKYSLRNLDMKESNFTFPVKKLKNVDLNGEELLLNDCIGGFRSKVESYFARLGKTFKRLDAQNNVRVTKLETYNIQLRLCCVLLNIKKVSELSHLHESYKYSSWLQHNFDYPNIHGIINKSDQVTYKLNNLKIIKNIQTDVLNILLNSNDDNDNIEDTYIEDSNILSINNSNVKTYEIQYISKHRIVNNNKEYYVKWKGYAKKYNSWLKEDDFIEKDILDEYNRDLMEEI